MGGQAAAVIQARRSGSLDQGGGSGHILGSTVQEVSAGFTEGACVL